MKSRLFTIPNVLTLSNLLCGSLAVVCVAVYGDLTSAFIFLIAAMVFDFSDGFAARILRQISPIGIILDSLADLVSFGLAPSFILFNLIKSTSLTTGYPFIDDFGGYLAFIVVLFSALRLARFSVEESQCDTFIGLPTPACALLISSLGLLFEVKGLDLGLSLYTLLAIVLSFMLVSEMPMLTLKFKSFGLKGNVERYIFLLICVVEVALLQLYAVPLIIATYMLFSLVSLFVKMGGGNAKG